MQDYADVSPPITHMQALHLELLRSVRYNEFDGEAIVRDLLAHRDLWSAVMGERLPPPISDRLAKRKGEYIDLCRLRYLRADRWAVDSLLILTTKEHLDALKARIKEHWRADEIEVVDREEVRWCMGLNVADNDVVLYLWWD